MQSFFYSEKFAIIGQNCFHQQIHLLLISMKCLSGPCEKDMGLFCGQNIEHGYINVLFIYVIVMRYNTSCKIK